MTNYQDEIDLRPYLIALLQRWRVIVLIGVIAALLALGISLTSPRKYASTAIILVISPECYIIPGGTIPNSKGTCGYWVTYGCILDHRPEFVHDNDGF